MLLEEKKLRFTRSERVLSQTRYVFHQYHTIKKMDGEHPDNSYHKLFLDRKSEYEKIQKLINGLEQNNEYKVYEEVPWESWSQFIRNQYIGTVYSMFSLHLDELIESIPLDVYDVDRETNTVVYDNGHKDRLCYQIIGFQTEKPFSYEKHNDNAVYKVFLSNKHTNQETVIGKFFLTDKIHE